MAAPKNRVNLLILLSSLLLLILVIEILDSLHDSSNEFSCFLEDWNLGTCGYPLILECDIVMSGSWISGRYSTFSCRCCESPIFPSPDTAALYQAELR